MSAIVEHTNSPLRAHLRRSTSEIRRNTCVDCRLENLILEKPAILQARRSLCPISFVNTDALEIYGRDFNIHDNNISQYAIEGMSPSSLYNATIANNTIENVDTAGHNDGGIQALTSFSTGGCSGNPRDFQTATISGNTSTGQQYGLLFGDQGQPSRLTLSGLAISGNTLGPTAIGVDPAIQLNSYSGPTPSGTGRTFATPRALGVDAVSPNPYRCSTPGADEETFKFAGHDNSGSSNIQWIQGIFSISGDDGSGTGGPDTGAYGCHFIYYPAPYNLVYLDGPSGGNLWVGSSTVGSGGSDLTNGYCTIHAGSTDSQVTTEPFIVDVALDITFPSSSSSSERKHIYSIVGNDSGGLSNSNVWNYWGWWATP